MRAVSAYWEDMPTSLRYDRVIAAGTSRRAAGLFMCSNLPYLGVALLFGCASDIRFPLAGGALCQSRELYVIVSLAMFVVSSLMHLGQLQCCSGLPPAWTIRLKHADVGCVLAMIATPVLCAQSLIPVGYIAPCLPLFVVSQHYKQDGRVQQYLIWHSLWHLATAAAAAMYVLQHWVPP